VRSLRFSDTTIGDLLLVNVLRDDGFRIDDGSRRLSDGYALPPDHGIAACAVLCRSALGAIRSLPSCDDPSETRIVV